MNRNRTLRQALPDYIPEAAVNMVAGWFDKNHVVLKITRNRRTKLGDFRGAPSGKPCSISVNNNLNKFNFLITLLHEMAHAEVHFNYTRRIAPHGKAWKLAYRRIAMPYIEYGIFPEDISQVYQRYLSNPLASSTSCLPLARALREYDINPQEMIVSMLKPETLFALPDGRVFKMMEKLRKRYRCYCLNNKRTYLFSAMAIIMPLEDNENPQVD